MQGEKTRNEWSEVCLKRREKYRDDASLSLDEGISLLVVLLFHSNVRKFACSKDRIPTADVAAMLWWNLAGGSSVQRRTGCLAADVTA